MVKRRYLVLKSLIIGLFSGSIAVAFRLALAHAEIIRNAGLIYFKQTAWFLSPLVFSLTLVFIIYCVKTLAPEAGGSGIPHLKGVLRGVFDFRALRVLAVKFLGGTVGIGAGLALGREGPTVQMEGAVGFLCAHLFSSRAAEQKILTCAGAGAGLAAAFNAPFAGVLFVLEELRGDFDRYTLLATFTSTIAANIICRMVFGQAPIFSLNLVEFSRVSLLFGCVFLGLFLGLGGLCFNLVLMKSVRALSAYKQAIGISLGIIFGIVGLYFPELLGSGNALMQRIFHDEFSMQALAAIFFLRFMFTMLSYNSGSPGGIFAPLLLLGGTLGVIGGKIISLYQPFDVTIALVLGMAGFFSAIVRSPVTGIMLILEMTNQFYLLFPLLVVSIVAYAVPEWFSNKPIYEDLLLCEIQKKFHNHQHVEQRAHGKEV